MLISFAFPSEFQKGSHYHSTLSNEQQIRKSLRPIPFEQTEQKRETQGFLPRCFLQKSIFDKSLSANLRDKVFTFCHASTLTPSGIEQTAPVSFPFGFQKQTLIWPVLNYCFFLAKKLYLRFLSKNYKPCIRLILRHDILSTGKRRPGYCADISICRLNIRK